MRTLIVISTLLFFSTFIAICDSVVTVSCSSSAQCGSNGVCNSAGTCNCTTGYVTVSSDQPCAYAQKKKLTAFLLSFLVGALGADWFYLSSGSAGYIVAGVFKLLTFGGLGIWQLVDWIRVLTDTFPDGQGAPLQSWD